MITKRRSHRYLVTGAIGLWLCVTATAVDAQQPTLTQVEANSAISDQQPCVVVRGAVLVAKRVELHRPLRLMEALFLAGGLTEGAGEGVRVIHSLSEIGCAQIPTWDWKPSEQQARSYSIAALKRDEESANPYLQPGDLVDVSEAERAYVVGNVLNPRAIYLRKSVTLTQAITMVGGVSPGSKTGKVGIIRQSGRSAAPDKITVDLKMIWKHRAGDFILQPNDIVEVVGNGKCSSNRMRVDWF